MWFSSLFQVVRRAPAGGGRKSRPGRRGWATWVKFNLESMEDRTLLASWINPLGGDWDTAGNWDTGTVPTAADDAVIPFSRIAVTHATGNADAVRSIVSDAALSFSSGSLTLGTASAIHNDLALVGGHLGGAGDLDVQGVLTRAGGTMDGGGTTTAEGDVHVTGPVTLGRPLTNTRNAALDGPSASISITAGGTINNVATGTFDLSNDQAISGPGRFENSGLVRRGITSGTFTIGTTLDNVGQVLVQSGTLSLSGGGFDTGDFTFDPTFGLTTLQFAGGSHTLAAGSILSAQNVVFSGGDVSVLGAYTVTTSTTVSGANLTVGGGVLATPGDVVNIVSGRAVFNTGFNFVTSQLNISGGELTGADPVTVGSLFNWSAGTLSGTGTVDVNGTLSVIGQVSLGRTLRNAVLGVIEGPSALLTLTSGASVENGAQAQFFLDNNQGISQLGSGSRFHNQGAVFREFGAGTFNVGTEFDNDGTVEVRTGTLNLSGGGTHTGRFIGLPDGFPEATLQFGGGTHRFLGGSSVTDLNDIVFSGGTASFDSDATAGPSVYHALDNTTVSGAVVNFNPGADVQLGVLPGFGVLVVTGGTANFSDGRPVDLVSLELSGGVLTGADPLTVRGFEWAAGTLSGAGTVDVNNTLNVIGAVTLGRTLRNTGVASITGPSASLTLTSGASIENQSQAAEFFLENNQGIFQSGSGSRFHNDQGLVVRDLDTGTFTVGTEFDNDGTVEVRTGTLNLSGGGTHTGEFLGQSLQFGGGTHHFLGGSGVEGVNDVVFSGGTVNFDTDATAGPSVYHVLVSTTVSGAVVNFNPGVDVLFGRSPGMLIVTGGTANFSDGGTVNAYSLEQSGGLLTGSDDITEEQVFIWSGGTLNGTGALNANGLISLFGGAVTLGRTLHNHHGALLEGLGSSITITTGPNNEGVFLNEAGADFELRNTQGVGGAGTFINRPGATIARDNNPGQTFISCAFFNEGTVDVQTGSLLLNGQGGSFGSFVGEAGTTIDFRGNYQLTGPTNVVSVPNVVFSGGTVVVGGTYDVSESTTCSGATVSITNPVSRAGGRIFVTGGTLSFDGGGSVSIDFLTLTGGTLTGSISIIVDLTFLWSGGTLAGGSNAVTFVGSFIDLTGSQKFLGRVLENDGTARWTGGGDIVAIGDNDAVFNNLAGGIFDIETDRSFFDDPHGHAVFNNDGLFEKTHSFGITTMFLQFNNTGMVDLETGTVDFRQGGPTPPPGGASQPPLGSALRPAGEITAMGGRQADALIEMLAARASGEAAAPSAPSHPGARAEDRGLSGSVPTEETDEVIQVSDEHGFAVKPAGGWEWYDGH